MEELKALIEALTKKVDALGTQFTAIEGKVDNIVKLSESAAEASKIFEDAFEVVEEITVAIGEAGLPKESTKKVTEAIKGGKKVADAVKDEAAYVKSVIEAHTKQIEEAGGRIVSGEDAGGFKLGQLTEVGS